MGEVLDGVAVLRWSRLTAEALGRARAEIDALNVFPVPDGDTGTNLYLTVIAAADALDELPDGEPPDSARIWRALAQGALLGARGNSGVILSQVFRGLADVLGPLEGPPDGTAFAGALAHASGLAREAVERPVEGTILSVLAAAAAACGAESSGTGLAGVTRAAAAGARRALGRTTGQLDVLARSGVVDAGAAGLCVVLDVLAAVVTEEYPERYEVPPRAAPPRTAGAPPAEEHPGPQGPGYEVMYLLDAPDEAVHVLRERLDGLGDSLVVVGGDGLWNVHVHVDDAGAAIEAGMAAGRPHRIRVTYLDAGERPHAPHTGRAVIAVTAAGGLAALFEECGARVVRRESGTVPPLAVLADAILAAGDEVAVLPNEPEVLALAEAAAERARDSGARIAVVPTKASVQGMAALAVHDPLRRFGEDVIEMTRAAGATRFGHLEVAEQEAVTSVGLCRPGDVLGLIEGDVVTIGADVAEVARHLLNRMLSGGGELVTLIAGVHAPPALAGALEDHLRGDHPDVEVGVYDGGQERYPLLIGVE
ncbi:DAK2 domain-containing protein [Actinomadura livida]|uniref:DAK2 domain fusion protein YloV n=1 Tax=Actinomadura livida TaxID=79909 RepID=A0A7W7IH63_9ACTN|nr:MULTISPECIES: DAK2 domain-containing protein [Actinomadura]MBB4776905.1 DAK2 domain fusion protein YloV [Actinomadura catellatispora]GGT95639.1 dihydroxyacetone kinase [Actinomadura livida]